MRCPNCGYEVGPADRFCRQCGTPRPQLPPHFAQSQSRLEALEASFQAGQIDGASFEAQRQALTVQASDGSYWTPGGGGRWYWYNGASWVEREPPYQAGGAPTPSAAPAQVPAQQAPAVPGKRPVWFWVAIGAAAVVFLAAAVFVALRFGPTWFGRDADLTPTAVASGATPGASSTPAAGIHIATFDEGSPTLFSSQSGAGGQAAIEGDRLCIQVSQADHTFASAWDSALLDLGFDVDATPVDGAPGTGYGVFVRGVDADGGGALIFEINGQGQWRMRTKAPGGGYTELQTWTDAAAIEVGGATNLVSALTEGSQASFLVNGEEIANIDAAPAEGAVVGLVVSTPAGQSSGKACFDLFRASAILETPPDDRQTVLAELGAPQTFDIAFGWDENGVPVRYETWTYFDYLTDFVFIDGMLIESEALEPIDELLVAPTWYSPFDFSAAMTLQQIEALLGEGELARVDVPPELGEDMVFYAGEQIVFGFVEGKLEYVETLALGAMEEAE